MPADAAGTMEVHEYRSDSEHSDADEDLEPDPGPPKNKTGGNMRILYSMKLQKHRLF